MVNQGSLAVNNNYTLAYNPANFKINKAKLTVTANNKTRQFSSPNPILTLTYSGFANSDDSTKLTTLPVISTNATIASPVGNYPINVSGGSALNYDLIYIAGTLIVTPIPPPVITSVSPNTATAGQTIIISGSNLTGTNAVTFGGVAATSFTINSAGNLTAIVPAARNNGISVTTNAGSANYTFNFVPVPVVTASSSTVIFGSNVTLSASPDTGKFSYQWVKDGANIAGASSSSYLATDGGVYSVKIMLNGVSQTSLPVTLTSVFVLPANNFQLTLTGATCKGSANGSINIKANQHLNYTATITGNGLNMPYPFTDSLQINNLAAGTYNFCITVVNQPNFSQCFTSVITEPKDISLYTVVSPSGSQAILSLNGGNTYNININGTNYATQSNQFTASLQKGPNRIIVTTDVPCQGSLEKDIIIPFGKMTYPNPFSDVTNLYLGEDVIKNALVTVNDAGEGKKLFSTQYYNVSGVIQINLGNLKSGVYFLSLSADGVVQVFKIIKQ